VYFYALNPTDIIPTVNLGFSTFSDVPLFWVVFSSLLAGIVWALLVFFVQELRLRIKLIKLKNENSMIRKELDSLRLLPLSGIVSEEKKR
jgi:uncharacterized integral membrane protein